METLKLSIRYAFLLVIMTSPITIGALASVITKSECVGMGVCLFISIAMLVVVIKMASRD